MTPAKYTYQDIAAATGIPAPTIRVWKNRGKLPPPDHVYGQTPVWDAQTIEPWIRENGKHETQDTDNPGRAP